MTTQWPGALSASLRRQQQGSLLPCGLQLLGRRCNAPPPRCLHCPQCCRYRCRCQQGHHHPWRHHRCLCCLHHHCCCAVVFAAAAVAVVAAAVAVIAAVAIATTACLCCSIHWLVVALLSAICFHHCMPSCHHQCSCCQMLSLPVVVHCHHNRHCNKNDQRLASLLSLFISVVILLLACC